MPLRKPRAEVEVTAKDNTQSGLKQAEGSFKRFGSVVKNVLAPLAAFFTARALGGFFKSAVQEATKADQIWNTLAVSVENMGVKFQDAEGGLRKLAGQMQATTRFGDEDFANSLTRLINITGDYNKSLESTQIAAGLAVRQNIDLQTASDLVGRALVGQTGTLTRYGIILDKNRDTMEQLREMTRGFAEKDGQTLGGLLARLRNGWTDFLEAVGKAILRNEKLQTGVNNVIKKLAELARWIDENSSTIDKFINAFLTGINGVIKAIGVMMDVLGVSLQGWRLYFNEVQQGWRNTKTTIENTAGVLTTVVGTFLRNESLIRKGLELQANAAEQAKKDAEEYEKVLLRIYNLQRQPPATTPTPTPTPTGTQTTETPEQRAAREAREARLRQNEQDVRISAGRLETQPATIDIRRPTLQPAEVVQPAVESISGLTVALEQANSAFNRTIEEGFGGLIGKTFQLTESLGNLAGNVLVNLGDAFADAFESIGQGANAFNQLTAAIKKSVAQAAAAEGRLVILKGFAKIAESIFPPNPAGLLSGAKMVAAGGALMALAGTLGGGGLGGRAGGAGPGTVGGLQDQLDRTSGASEPRPTTIIVNGSFLDMSDPRQADAFSTALGEATRRQFVIETR